MLVTLSGITSLLKEEQPINAQVPMLVTLLGITRLLKELHAVNAPSLMVVILSERTISVKEQQSPYLLLVDYQYYTL